MYTRGSRKGAFTLHVPVNLPAVPGKSSCMVNARDRTVHFGKPVRNSSRLPRGLEGVEERRETGFPASKFFMAVNFSREGGSIFLVL